MDVGLEGVEVGEVERLERKGVTPLTMDGGSKMVEV